ncbi:portal protein [Burkholderia cenocepacia]|uniref:portal protein n=1 Tax=Burkholderia cenocepacia TaxID=95486 RepID=UPI001907B9E2|nr:portal protein [Burkholderia cenocepacia]MBJ9895239.1 head-tail connector protein [Burkholderia cenocepacia]MBJ9917657.1 head-tail connector protein [Burkholderia cenocepacia]
MIDSLGETLAKRLETLKSKRQVHELVWRNCFMLTDPVRASGLNGPMMDANQIAQAVSLIFDSTATDAKRTLEASIMSGMTPANSLWFTMTVNGTDDDGERWLDEASEVLWQNIHSANFDSEAADGIADCMAGWFALYVDENRDTGGLYFEHWPMAGVYCAASKQGGPVDIVFRCYQLTAEQCVTDFKQRGDSLPPEILDKAKTKPDELIDLCQAIYPRDVFIVGALRAKNMPIASVTFACNHKYVIRESGYHEMPVIVARWKKIPNSVYGVGPLLDALPDIRTLNDIVKLEYANLDLAVSGMWIAEDDGVLNPRTVKVGPRKVIVANSVDSMKPLQPSSNFKLAETRIEKLQAQIRKTLMADQLQPQDGPAMTATEVHVRVDLIRQLLGPIYGRLQAEYLQPLIARCFGLAYRAGVFPPPPDSLGGQNFAVQYQSPLARAQKLEEVSAIERLMGDLTVIAQVDQTAIDNVDTDEAVRQTAKNLGVPDAIMRPVKDVAAFRQQKQAAAAQQAQQQMGMEVQGDVMKSMGSAAAGRMVANQ